MMFSHSMIRVALLGTDDTTPEFVAQLLRDARFELVGVCEFREGPTTDLVTDFPVFDSWEALLDLRTADAVIVTRDDDEDRRAEQIRKFLQAGMPVLAAHPLFESMLVYYELDMIRRETGGLILPLVPWRRHPAVEHLAAMISNPAASPIGRVEQLSIDRRLALGSRREVLTWFARDVDLIRALAGEINRLGAMAAGGDQASYAGLGVQMSGPGDVVARWSAARGDEGARLTLIGGHGRAILDAAPGAQAWLQTLEVGGARDCRSYEPWNPWGAALDQLAEALAGQPAGAGWVDAARSVELAETIDRSLSKQRTIELHFEEYTEAGTFKGLMTSLGCGLLVLTVLLLGAVAIAEQLGVPNLRWWPYVLAAVLGSFLLLQTLLWVSRPSGEDAAGTRLGAGEAAGD